ncbi:hypothetical protein, partial [Nitrobacter sp.]|uniref:hypothetical protein n=1 Tax=Nitrobacter sp. TaxID=29420 RepID=UPI001D9A6C09
RETVSMLCIRIRLALGSFTNAIAFLNEAVRGMQVGGQRFLGRGFLGRVSDTIFAVYIDRPTGIDRARNRRHNV